MKTKNFTEARKYFFEFYESVKAAHNSTTNKDHGGHGLDHDITVAAIAIKIAPDEYTGQKAWCASFLHSFDRIFAGVDLKNQMAKYAENLRKFFNDEEINEIVEAAYRHDELNQSDQTLTQVTLMDADRLANMQSAVIIRAGQFHQNIPVLDFNFLDGKADPVSTYKSPKNILDNLRFIITSYIPQLRLPIAKNLGDIYAERLSSYIESIEEDYRELGLKGLII